jgi:hypothetical protein
MAASTTPGPETPTLITTSGSPTPCIAPAMKGLSSGALAKTTSRAQAAPCSIRRLASTMTSPIAATASMLIPAREEARFTLEQTRVVSPSTSGMLRISRASPGVAPLCTRAE